MGRQRLLMPAPRIRVNIQPNLIFAHFRFCFPLASGNLGKFAGGLVPFLCHSNRFSPNSSSNCLVSSTLVSSNSPVFGLKVTAVNGLNPSACVTFPCGGKGGFLGGGLLHLGGL